MKEICKLNLGESYENISKLVKQVTWSFTKASNF